jgi:8-oxo-dGTP diphosphatase
VTAAAAPAVAIDVAVFTVLDGVLHVLLVQPRAGAFAGAWALPGGRVGPEESLDQAARRELAAQTGLRRVHLEQLYTFGSPRRDPQGHVVSVAYLGLIADGGRLREPARAAGAGARKYARVVWRRAARLPPLAYDHRAVVGTALRRLRAKLEYTNLVFTLLPPAFTLGELHAMYEAVLGRALDRRNFRKRMLGLGLLRALGRVRRGRHRPAALYAFRRRRPTIIPVLQRPPRH